jgi:hypothetical protein
MDKHRWRRYSAYAIGEIVLVVLGILIALQINNANEERQERQREARYLENLKVDLEFSIRELDRFIEVRQSRIESAQRILDHFNGKPVEDLRDFAYDNVHVQTWQRYYQNINTFEELVNSGNLGIISSNEIKHALMDLELSYEKMKGDEDHMRFDFEGYVYTPFFDAVDIEPMSENYAFTASQGQVGSQPPLSRADVEALLQDVRFKNGFTLVAYMMRTLNARFAEMRAITTHLVALIDQELAKRD